MNNKVIFVSMPFDSLDRPNIGVSLLKSILVEEGYEVEVLYPKYSLANLIGEPEYRFISEVMDPSFLSGEWIFSPFVSGYLASKSQEYMTKVIKRDPVYYARLNTILNSYGVSEDVEDLLYRVQGLIKEWLDELAKEIISKNPGFVGCSSSFEQNNASLSLLKRIKEKNSIITFLGGANCEDELGKAIFDNYHFIDFVMSGEGEINIVKVCNNQYKNRAFITNDGYIDLDKYPTPDYTDFFIEREKSGYLNHSSCEMLIEGSRGCWWGENTKRRCSFCSLNGNLSKYRRKNPEKLLNELKTLKRKHGISSFFFTDNIIDYGIFNDFYKSIINDGEKLNLRFECKSNLEKDEIKKLTEMGATWVQPGIENLHSQALIILSKGVTGLQNIAFLKYAMEEKLFVSWNYLTGMPDEKESWWKEIIEIIDQISHLQPPSGIFDIRFDKYSNYYNNPEKYGISLHSHPNYNYVYDLDKDSLSQISRYYLCTPDVTETEYKKELQYKIYNWMNSYNGESRRVLMAKKVDGKIYIKDTRDCKKADFHTLNATESLIYDYFNIPRGTSKTSEILDIDAETLNGIIDKLLEKQLILRMDNKLLSLATM